MWQLLPHCLLLVQVWAFSFTISTTSKFLKCFTVHSCSCQIADLCLVWSHKNAAKTFRVLLILISRQPNTVKTFKSDSNEMHRTLSEIYFFIASNYMLKYSI